MGGVFLGARKGVVRDSTHRPRAEREDPEPRQDLRHQVGRRLVDHHRVTDHYLEARHLFIAPGGRPGGAVDDVLAALGRRRRIAVAVPSFLMAPEIVASSDLVLTCPERLVSTGTPGLVSRPPPMALGGFTMSQLWHPRSDSDPAHVWLRSEVSAAVAAAAQPDVPAGASSPPLLGY